MQYILLAICIQCFSSCICSKENGNITIIGHRGSAKLAPENTIASIDSAITNKVQFAEIDIRRTKDGVIILMHDKDFNRTTNGTGDVNDRDFSYVKKLTIRHKFEQISNDIKVPTLDSVLTFIKDKEINLVIELKDPKDYPGIESQVVKLIGKYNLDKRVILASFDQQSLKQINNINSKIKIGAFAFFPKRIKTENLEFVGVYWPSVYLTPWLINDLKKRNIPIWVWTLDSHKIARKLAKKGINGIITNDPSLLKNN